MSLSIARQADVGSLFRSDALHPCRNHRRPPARRSHVFFRLSIATARMFSSRTWNAELRNVLPTATCVETLNNYCTIRFYRTHSHNAIRPSASAERITLNCGVHWRSPPLVTTPIFLIMTTSELWNANKIAVEVFEVIQRMQYNNHR